MAAPTPVSSLVHSSTLVTAGVFLIIRFYELLIPFIKILLVIALITLLLAGVIANLDWDLKKIIAFSTLSQLGFMVSSLASGLIFLRFFHLLCHALFKSSLFICSGVFIHNCDNRQEYRNNFNFLFITPIISSFIVVCLLCLIGFPFLTGFFSKDLIIDGTIFSLLGFIFFILGVILTVSYRIRFSFHVLISNLKFRYSNFYIYENIYFILLPIAILIFFSIFGGLFFLELYFSRIYILIVSLGWKLFYFRALSFAFFWFYLFKAFTGFNLFFLSSI
jgi:NADH-ubiquinone oxidoreductase chain 5